MGDFIRVIDLICSKHVPYGLKRIVDHLKSDISKGDIAPFYGRIYDQNGVLRNKDQKEMTHQDIMNMDWLLDNVTGTIPSMDSLIDKSENSC